jgi:hypothetical protein
MSNLNVLAYLANAYARKAYTHHYIFTFTYAGMVYATMLDLDANGLMNICKVDKASRGAGMALRFRPTVAIKRYLMTFDVTPLCTKTYFDEIVKASKYNRGEIAEKLVTEKMFGQKWHKDSVPFTKGGDIEANGIAYQHKHEGATFCNEKSIANL